MNPIEYLEQGKFWYWNGGAFVSGSGGGGYFANIKDDNCACRDESHDFYPEYRFDMELCHAELDYQSLPPLDPYDVAVKRGAPA